MNRDFKMPLARLIRWATSLWLATAAAIAGCGGGEGGVGVGGTGSFAFASGPITGFGSVIVNGIEFDDSSARVEDEDGTASTRGALQFGMVVEVDSSGIGGSADAPTAVASRIRFGSEIVGPVTSVDVAGNSLVVFGQTVLVRATTVFDPRLPTGLASVAIGSIVGSIVEVYGFWDASSSRFVATRIEPRSGPVAFFKVHGPIQNHQMGARTFTIGPVGFSYAMAPGGMDNGVFVRLQVETTPVAGRWMVRAFGDGMRRLPDLDEARLRGPISAFTSSRSFSVNGQRVDASVASFPNGEAGLDLGVRVEVEGPVTSGVVHATKVEIDNDGGPQGGFELRGMIESHQPALQTFVLKGVTVFYGAPGVFDKGTAADLGPGVPVEARGMLSSDGTRLFATRIRVKT